MNDKSGINVRLDVHYTERNEMKQEKFSPNDTICFKCIINVNLKFILLTVSFKLLTATLRYLASMQDW